MASWQSRTFNKLLFRVMRSRLQHCNDIYEMRAVISGIDRLSAFIRVPDGMTRKEETIDGVRCEWIETQESNAMRTLLFFHGGGFCFRSPGVHGAMLGRLSAISGVRGLLPYYRLAPEHPFPAAIDDCFGVYAWLVEQGVEPSTIVLGGDSAGGNLVLSTLLKCQQEGVPLPAGGIMFSPASDLAMTGYSAFEQRNTDPFFDVASLLLMRNCYLDGHMPCDPLASPYYGHFVDLPPLMLHVGTEEMLRDDSIRLAEKLKRSGISIEFKVWEGMPHVFPIFHQLPEAQQALEICAEFITRVIPDPVEPLPGA